MRWLAVALLAGTGCSNGILYCPGVAGGSDWICPGGEPNACALPPKLCSTSDLVEACKVDGVFMDDFTPCTFPGPAAGRCLSGECELCTQDYAGCSYPGWTAMTSPVSVDLHGVFEVGSGDAYAVGDNGTLLHYDGTAWSALPGGPANAKLTGVVGTASGVFAIDAAGEVFTVDSSGNLVLAYTARAPLKAIAATGRTVTAVGFGGDIVQFDGTQWTDVSIGGVAKTLTGVWGNDTDVFIVGKGGTVLQNGSAAVTPGSAADFNAVWGTDASDVYAVSAAPLNEHPEILHFDGTTWTATTLMVVTADLLSVWGSGPNDVFVSAAQTSIVHCDGPNCVWSLMPVPATAGAPDIDAIEGLSSIDAYAVGSAGTLWRYGGSNN